MHPGGKMFKQSILTTAALTLCLVASPTLSAAARSGKAYAVGSGLAYPTLNHSLFVNPTALVDSPKASLQASYLVDPEDIHASLTSGGSSVGFGVGYRQSGSSSTEEFGLAGRLNVLTLGVTLRTQEFDNVDADVGGSFDFGSMRLAVIGRSANGGFERLDAGLGFMAGPFTLGFDVKKPLASGSETLFFDAGLAVGDGKISAGMGYTFAYDGSEFVEGDIHAGLSLMVSNGIAAEAFYKPSTQEWAPGDWVVGVRVAL
jgi:hypothetical protein